MRSAQFAIGLLLTAALGACNREPAFDERFADAAASISASAEAIDAEIMATDSPMPPVIAKERVHPIPEM